MGARERGQCSRETRVGNLSRALPCAFSNERMVRARTRGMMYDGCCLPFSATPGSTSTLAHVQKAERQRGARRDWTASKTPDVLNIGQPPSKDPFDRNRVGDGVPSPPPSAPACPLHMQPPLHLSLALISNALERTGVCSTSWGGCTRNRRASTTSMLTERGTWPGESGGQARTSLGHVTGSNTRLALSSALRHSPYFIEKRQDAWRAWIAPASPHA